MFFCVLNIRILNLGLEEVDINAKLIERARRSGGGEGPRNRKHLVLRRSIADAAAIMILSLPLTYFLYKRDKQQLIFIDPGLANQEAQFYNQASLTDHIRELAPRTAAF